MLECFQGLAVQRDEPAVEAFYLHREDPGIGDVHQAKAKALVPGYRAAPAALAVDGDPVPESTSVRPVAHGPEALVVNARVLGEPPVINQ